MYESIHINVKFEKDKAAVNLFRRAKDRSLKIKKIIISASAFAKNSKKIGKT